MTAPKTKRTVSLDADLVAAVGDGNLSAEVNDALRSRLDDRRRRLALRGFLDGMTAEEGPVDEADVDVFVAALGGQPSSIHDTA